MYGFLFFCDLVFFCLLQFCVYLVGVGGWLCQFCYDVFDCDMLLLLVVDYVQLVEFDCELLLCVGLLVVILLFEYVQGEIEIVDSVGVYYCICFGDLYWMLVGCGVVWQVCVCGDLFLLDVLQFLINLFSDFKQQFLVSFYLVVVDVLLIILFGSCLCLFVGSFGQICLLLLLL